MSLKTKPNGLEDEEDDSAKLWFTNQLSDDACATLNVLLNVEEVDLGERLREFRDENERMSSPVCRSLICSFLAYLNFAAVDEGLSGLECPFHSTGTQRSRSVCLMYYNPHLSATRRYTGSHKRICDQDPRGRRKSRTLNEAPTCKTQKTRHHQEEETREPRCRSKSRRSLSFHWLFSLLREGMGTGRVEVQTCRGWGVVYIRPFTFRTWCSRQPKLDGCRRTGVEDEGAQVWRG